MIQPKLYFENKIATIAAHPDGYVLFTYQPGKRKPEQLQEVLRHMADLLEARGWHRILNDQRQLEPFTVEETAQAHTFWQQRTQQLGHGLCLASVLAHDVFARLAATSMRQELRDVGLGYRLFDNIPEAGAWLREQVIPPTLK